MDSNLKNSCSRIGVAFLSNVDDELNKLWLYWRIYQYVTLWRIIIIGLNMEHTSPTLFCIIVVSSTGRGGQRSGKSVQMSGLCRSGHAGTPIFIPQTTSHSKRKKLAMDRVEDSRRKASKGNFTLKKERHSFDPTNWCDAQEFSSWSVLYIELLLYSNGAERSYIWYTRRRLARFIPYWYTKIGDVLALKPQVQLLLDGKETVTLCKAMLSACNRTLSMQAENM